MATSEAEERAMRTIDPGRREQLALVAVEIALHATAAPREGDPQTARIKFEAIAVGDQMIALEVQVARMVFDVALERARSRQPYEAQRELRSLARAPSWERAFTYRVAAALVGEITGEAPCSPVLDAATRALDISALKAEAIEAIS